MFSFYKSVNLYLLVHISIDCPYFYGLSVKISDLLHLIVVSLDAPKVSARYIYDPTTLHDGSAMIHHGGATNAHVVQVWFMPVVPRHSPHAVFLMNRSGSECQ